MIRSAMLSIVFAALVTSGPVLAHFPWLCVQDDAAVLFFGEDITDRTYQLPKSLKAFPLQLATAGGAPVSLETVAVDTDKLVGLRVVNKELPSSGLIHGQATYGVYHGTKLTYYVQHALDLSNESLQAKSSNELQARLSKIPEGVRVVVMRQGKPLGDSTVKLYCDEGHLEAEHKTDSDGACEFTTSELEGGLNAIVVGAKEEETAGKVGDIPYTSETHYLTATFVWGEEKRDDSVDVSASGVADLPLELTSFGGAIHDGRLFVYGGHTGSAHSYSTAEQSNQFFSIDAQGAKQWTEHPAGPRLQGLALVSTPRGLYRIGGFTAMNEEGEEHDLHSQATVSRFDAEKNKWVEAPALPEPRSSFEACCVGTEIFVVGGWSLNGSDDSTWHSTAWRMDVAADNPKWVPIADPPFQRRALAVLAHEGKVHAIGGMAKQGGPTTRTDVYDPKTDTWTKGANLQGAPMSGFGCNGDSMGGRLVITTVTGEVQVLSEDDQTWQVQGKLKPGRFFHFVAPVNDDTLLLVGGANMSIGKFTEVQKVTLGQAN